MGILFKAFVGKAIGQSKQNALKLLLRTSKVFSFTMTQSRERWLKIETFPRDYVLLALLPILYLSRLSPTQVFDLLFLFSSLYPKLIENKILFKNKNPQRDWKMSHSVSWGNKHFSCGKNLSFLILSFQGAPWPQFVKRFNSTHKKIVLGLKQHPK